MSNYGEFKTQLLVLMIFTFMDDEEIDEKVQEWYIMYRETPYPNVKEWAEWQFPADEVSEDTHLFWLKRRIIEITPQDVVIMPDKLVDGVLYVSKKFNLAIHLCACGCRGKTVTPLDEWKLTEKNGKVTLRPSIGNWSGERQYHAHYYITDNKIDWR